MKITLNELRKIINNNLLNEGLNFEVLAEQNPPYYQRFKEIFDKACFKFQLMLGQNDKKGRGMKINTDWNMIDQIFNAYLKYMLICVIEKGMPYAPINYVGNQITNLDNFDINNPTGGIKGKFTEFIVKVLASPNWGLYLEDEGEGKLYSFKILNEFINICEKSGSNLYKAKMNFFDTQVMPFLVKKQEEGKIRNVPKVSPQSPLQDKIARVFDDFGNVNGKNLIEIMLDEVMPEENAIGDTNIQTFAGYDVKLIDFCLQHNYWQEINLPGQPANYRIFFINGGNNSKFPNDKNKIKEKIGITRDELLEKWHNDEDILCKLEERADEKGENFEDYFYEMFEKAWEREEKKENTPASSSNMQFSYRGMIYANNIYPFKTPYNASKSTLSKNVNISYFKSIKDDDYLVTTDNDEFQIRKTTDWCTKDMDTFAGYVFGKGIQKDLINGFLLILDNSLPYNDPNGAALIGLTRDEFHVRNKNGKIIPKLTEYFYKTVYELNADDKTYVLPQFITEFTKERNEFSLMIDQLKKKYFNLINVKVDLRDIQSGQQAHQLLQKLLNEKNLSENSYKLLSSYIRYILT